MPEITILGEEGMFAPAPRAHARCAHPAPKAPPPREHPPAVPAGHPAGAAHSKA
jgi:hypothetical protein